MCTCKGLTQQDSYRVPTGFLYRIPTGILQDSYSISTGFLQVPTGFLQDSYRIPTRFIHDFYKTPTSSYRISTGLLVFFCFFDCLCLAVWLLCACTIMRTYGDTKVHVLTSSHCSATMAIIFVIYLPMSRRCACP